MWWLWWGWWVWWVSAVLSGVCAGDGSEGELCAGSELRRCWCWEGGVRMSCAGVGLREPPTLHHRLLVLDLSGNNITTLHRASLHPAHSLRDLNLSENQLESISSGALAGLTSLARLSLASCGLRRLPAHALRSLPTLHHLSLENNQLLEVEGGGLEGVRALRTLRLDRNLLSAVPTRALEPLSQLQILNLAGNLISELSDTSLPPLPALHTLILRRNRITHVEERAFASVPALRALRFEDNLLPEVPLAVQLLPQLEDLSVSNNRIDGLSAGVLQRCTRLARLELRGNPLHRLHPHALHHLPQLRTLVVSEARGLAVLPSLNGSARLETLRADRCRLTHLSPALCRHAPRLRTLDIKSNELQELPDLHECSELRVLEASSNAVRSLEGRPLRGLSRLHDLLLAHNRLTALPGDLFRDTPRLQTLDLEDNLIEHIESDAFIPISKLEDLNVANNRFPQLPADGLQHLMHLKAHNNPHLRRFHPPEMFPRIQTLVLSYAYHCCEFMPLMESEPEQEKPARATLSDFVLIPTKELDLAAWANATDLWPHYANLSGPDGARLRRLLEAWGSASPVRAGGAPDEGPEPRPASPRRVRCLPLPGPFLPCVDLFDWWTLRCGVWAVFLLALLGNGTVVFVLVFSRSRMDVPRFLVANLAAADLFMGVYLGLLAVVDAGTLGEFRAHAIAWQLSGGCRLAGFLGVLSSELSVYTLAVITLERNYAITHAMHLNKRLSLRHAAAVMAVGWTFSLTAAALPLAGVSDYRKFAVCLPFETATPVALGYVVALLAINGVAFLVLLGCYLKMYCAIRGSQAWNSNDSRIAKRMALLVFTDFLCWSPIAFFALTAAFGTRLVSLEQAKVLTVFVLPLNSCCNPFLYAILTKQFKKDCTLVCKAIEESRVTRGIGRCRHSSNFSNRQTPANTNSLVERSSRGNHAPTCACRARLLPAAGALAARPGPEPDAGPARGRLLRWLGTCGGRVPAEAGVGTRAGGAGPRAGGAGPARAGSMSSSVEFSSSRSDSWRAAGGAVRGGLPRRAASWLVARKTSQDSNLSSSRNDSSGSAATASTGTWRTSRSGGSGARPRLQRQPAVLGDEPPLSPPAAPAPAPRHLHTIPSATEPDPPPEDAPPPPSCDQCRPCV